MSKLAPLGFAGQREIGAGGGDQGFDFTWRNVVADELEKAPVAARGGPLRPRHRGEPRGRSAERRKVRRGRRPGPGRGLKDSARGVISRPRARNANDVRW